MNEASSRSALQETRHKLESLGWLRRLRAYAATGAIYSFFGSLALMRRILKRRYECDADLQTLRSARYRDPRSSHNLTDAQLEHFEQKGFVGPFRIVSPTEAARLAERTRNSVMQEPIAFGRFHELPEEERQRRLDGQAETVVERGWFRHTNVPEIHGLLTAPEVVGRVASLLGEDVLLWRSQCFEIPPGGEGTGMHSASFREGAVDGCLAPPDDRPAALLGINVSVALSDADESSGCLRFAPGTHRQRLYTDLADISTAFEFFFAHGWRAALELANVIAVNLTVGGKTMHFAIGSFLQQRALELEGIKEPQPVCVPMKAGEFCLFTEATRHGSMPNASDSVARFSLTGRYTSGDVRAFPKAVYADDIHFLPDKVSAPREALGVTAVHKRSDAAAPPPDAAVVGGDASIN